MRLAISGWFTRAGLVCVASVCLLPVFSDTAMGGGPCYLVHYDQHDDTAAAPANASVSVTILDYATCQTTPITGAFNRVIGFEITQTDSADVTRVYVPGMEP